MEHLTRQQIVVMLTDRTTGMTMRGAAAKVGVSHAYLHDVLNGRRWPGPKICEYLGYVEVKAEPMYAPRKYRRAK